MNPYDELDMNEEEQLDDDYQDDIDEYGEEYDEDDLIPFEG